MSGIKNLLLLLLQYVNADLNGRKKGATKSANYLMMDVTHITENSSV